jgi:hypothetical protein
MRLKGFDVRKVGFKSSVSGHFASEVRVNDQHYFVDTNLEARLEDFANLPSAEELVKNKDMLKAAYPHLKPQTLKVFTENPPFLGAFNAELAKNANFFHRFCYFLIYALPAFSFFLYLTVRRKSIGRIAQK